VLLTNKNINVKCDETTLEHDQNNN